MPFLYLGIVYNKQRDCHKYYTRFNFFDIIVTVLSSFIIILEDMEQEKKRELYGTHVVGKFTRILEEDFETFKKEAVFQHQNEKSGSEHLRKLTNE